MALADIQVKTVGGANAALLTWNGDANTTYNILGREQGTTQEVKRSIYPIKGSEFLDASLETKTFEYKVQQLDGSGKVTAESAWTPVTPTGGGQLAWAVFPPGDPDAPFDAGAVADGAAGDGKIYVDGAYYGATVSTPHKTNSQLHYVTAKVDPAGWAAGDHSLVITVPGPNGGFLPTTKMYVKMMGGGSGGAAAGGLPVLPIVGGVIGLVVLIGLVSLAKKPKAG